MQHAVPSELDLCWAGLLPELDMLRLLLEKSPEWADDARDVAERQLKLCSNIASRFNRLGKVYRYQAAFSADVSQQIIASQLCCLITSRLWNPTDPNAILCPRGLLV